MAPAGLSLCKITAYPTKAPLDHYENFPVASVLLPGHLREAVQLIYQFARAADDFADEGDLSNAQRLALLASFGDELRLLESGKSSRIRLFEELGRIIRQHELPYGLFHDLLSAFAQDVTQKRYADFSELLDYCRRSANPVGRLLLRLYRADNPQNLARADLICSSLQIINFLQDVAIDYDKGRIYLPLDDLARFGVAEADIAARDAGRAWCHCMAFQVNRARRMLLDGAPLGRVLKGRIGLEMRMIIAGGDRILTKILACGGDVFRRRPVLRAYDWPLMLARTLSLR